jgi:4-hydroxy-tetrahydrodipicolinate synthase
MSKHPVFKGSYTALVTPFKDGKLDEQAFRKFVAWQIEQGTHGLVPMGTTGESSTVSHVEHKQVVEWCIDEVKAARKDVMVVAGAGSNSTAEAIDFAKHGEKAGANGLLVVTPYYNRPSQEGMYQHFKAINDAVGIPILIYNIPPRSAVDMSVDTMKRLYELKNITGVKDATSNIARVSLQRLAMPGFNQLSAEDATALAFMAHGGHGCISVTSNVAPKLCAVFQNACLVGNFATALELHDKLMPLHTALFLEPNPAGPKYALSRLGVMSDEIRLPMTSLSSNPATQPVKDAIDKALAHAGLI